MQGQLCAHLPENYGRFFGEMFVILRDPVPLTQTDIEHLVGGTCQAPNATGNSPGRCF
jgi:hypothetical protein